MIREPKITIESLEAILKTMYRRSIKSGYMTTFDGKLTLFEAEPPFAARQITRIEIINFIKTLEQ